MRHTGPTHFVVERALAICVRCSLPPGLGHAHLVEFTPQGCVHTTTHALKTVTHVSQLHGQTIPIISFATRHLSCHGPFSCELHLCSVKHPRGASAGPEQPPARRHALQRLWRLATRWGSLIVSVVSARKACRQKRNGMAHKYGSAESQVIPNHTHSEQLESRTSCVTHKTQREGTCWMCGGTDSRGHREP